MVCETLFRHTEGKKLFTAAPSCRYKPPNSLSPCDNYFIFLLFLNFTAVFSVKFYFSKKPSVSHLRIRTAPELSHDRAGARVTAAVPGLNFLTINPKQKLLGGETPIR